MTKVQSKGRVVDIKGLLESDGDFLRSAVKAALEAALDAEMTEVIGAAKGERTEARLGYRSGYYQRSRVTRVGTLELRVPQDREGRFSTQLFERYQRSEKALVSALAEMYVQDASRRLRRRAMRPSLTAAARGALTISGRGEETPFSRTRKRHSVYRIDNLQTLTDTTRGDCATSVQLK